MYAFYRDVYRGTAISEEDWPALEARARAQLERYKRTYRVRGSAAAEQNAVCAMAEAMDYFTAAQNGLGGLRYASVGSVSVSGKGIYTQVDISPAAQERELYRCAGLYLDICRGTGPGAPMQN